MRQLVHYYYHDVKLLAWIKENKIYNSDKLLIEINFPSDDKEKLKNLLGRIKIIFPSATVIGMQSFTSFVNHTITDINPQPIISIIEFESSSISSLVLDLDKNYTKGKDQELDIELIEEYLHSDTQALQVLSSYNESNTSSYINSLGTTFAHLKIFGGGATNKNPNSENAFIFHNGNIYSKAIILSFNSI